ncbi:hypothetical protein KM043_016460 [Ampulex compressa]|nr:hypothetical protein KM043_016460 [Ampulex compressa]
METTGTSAAKRPRPQSTPTSSPEGVSELQPAIQLYTLGDFDRFDSEIKGHEYNLEATLPAKETKARTTAINEAMAYMRHLHNRISRAYIDLAARYSEMYELKNQFVSVIGACKPEVLQEELYSIKHHLEEAVKGEVHKVLQASVEFHSTLKENICSKITDSVSSVISANVCGGANKSNPVAQSYAAAARPNTIQASCPVAISKTRMIPVGKLIEFTVEPSPSRRSEYPDSNTIKRELLAKVCPKKYNICAKSVIVLKHCAVRILAETVNLPELKASPELKEMGLQICDKPLLRPRLIIRNVPDSISSDRLAQEICERNLEGIDPTSIKTTFVYPCIKDRKDRSIIVEVTPESLLSPPVISTPLARAPRINLHQPDTEHGDGPSLENYECQECGRAFGTKRGLGVHRRAMHPGEVNAEIDLSRRKYRWQEEDIRRIAYAELQAGYAPDINLYILATVRLHPERTLEAIKGLRKRPVYKRMLMELATTAGQPVIDAQHVEATRIVESMDSHARVVTQNFLENGHIPLPLRDIDSERTSWFRAAIRYTHSARCTDPGKHLLIDALNATLTRNDPEPFLTEWFQLRFSQEGLSNLCRSVETPGMDGRELSGRARRRQEYANIQYLWRRNQAKAANKILEGASEGLPHPTLEMQTGYWQPLLEQNSTEYPRQVTPALTQGEIDANQGINTPITTEEVRHCKLDVRSASGPDRLQVGMWVKSVSDMVKAIIMNIIVEHGNVPRIWRDARTIMVPKIDGSLDPSHYRPISVSSIVLRNLHKIFAARITRRFQFDERQRGFVRADGAAENLITLSSIIDDAWTNGKQTHICFLDVRKAFDSVSHQAMAGVLTKRGFPGDFIAYVMKLYREAVMQIEVDGKLSPPILPGRGIRQGDPLSSIFFNLIMDEVLGQVPVNVGFCLNGESINALAFADDLVLVTATVAGMQDTLNAVSKGLRSHGLMPAPQKCRCLSIIPSGRDKKVKLITDPLFKILDSPVPQVTFADTWKHLGVVFNARGPVKATVNIKQDGGLGVIAFESKIPELTKRRLEGLAASPSTAARAAYDTRWVRARLGWCNILLSKKINWASALHRSVDGYELRESNKSQASYS